MAKIMTSTDTTTIIDAKGNTQTTTTEKTKAIEVSSEPDFVKLYTRVWCEFNGIPDRWRNLFLALICRMSYCCKTNLDHSQLVNTAEPWATGICEELGWTHKNNLKQGLAALCKCNAIKRMGRGIYQINPSYAGRGEWKYNPRLDRGGVEDLVATFDFRTGSVQTQITWTSDLDPDKTITIATIKQDDNPTEEKSDS